MAVAVVGVPESIDDTIVGFFDVLRGKAVVTVLEVGFEVASGADQVFLKLGAGVTACGRIVGGW